PAPGLLRCRSPWIPLSLMHIAYSSLIHAFKKFRIVIPLASERFALCIYKSPFALVLYAGYPIYKPFLIAAGQEADQRYRYFVLGWYHQLSGRVDEPPGAAYLHRGQAISAEQFCVGILGLDNQFPLFVHITPCLFNVHRGQTVADRPRLVKLRLDHPFPLRVDKAQLVILPRVGQRFLSQKGPHLG